MFIRLFVLVFSLGIPLLHAFSLSAICTRETVEVIASFEERFFGRLKLRSDPNCFVEGGGKRLLLLSAPLQAVRVERCAITQYGQEFAGVFELEFNRNLISALDSSFLIKCPVRFDLPTQALPASSKSMNAPIKADLRIRSPYGFVGIAQVGRSYSFEIQLFNEPNESYARLGQCLAFDPKSMTKIFELTSRTGCAQTPQFASEMKWSEDGSRLSAQLEMFAPFDSEDFVLQCQLHRCTRRCLPVVCDLRHADQLQGIVEENAFWLTSTRVRLIKAGSDQQNAGILGFSNSTNANCSSEKEVCIFVNPHFLAAIIGVLCVATTLSWFHACRRRPKDLSAMFSSSNRISSGNGFSRLSNSATHSNDESGSRRCTPESIDVDELINENRELRHILKKSPEKTPVSFLGLDLLPDPPKISVVEIQAMNRAFNQTIVTTQPPLPASSPPQSPNEQEDVQSLSPRSVQSNVTLDATPPRVHSSCSTVDFRKKEAGTKEEPPKKPNIKLIQIPQSKTATKPSGKLEQSDQKLHSLLQFLKSEVNKKQAEAVAAEEQSKKHWMQQL